MNKQYFEELFLATKKKAINLLVFLVNKTAELLATEKAQKTLHHARQAKSRLFAFREEHTPHFDRMVIGVVGAIVLIAVVSAIIGGDEQPSEQTQKEGSDKVVSTVYDQQPSVVAKTYNLDNAATPKISNKTVLNHIEITNSQITLAKDEFETMKVARLDTIKKHKSIQEYIKKMDEEMSQMTNSLSIFKRKVENNDFTMDEYNPTFAYTQISLEKFNKHLQLMKQFFFAYDAALMNYNAPYGIVVTKTNLEEFNNKKTTFLRDVKKGIRAFDDIGFAFAEDSDTFSFLYDKKEIVLMPGNVEPEKATAEKK